MAERSLFDNEYELDLDDFQQAFLRAFVERTVSWSAAEDTFVDVPVSGGFASQGKPVDRLLLGVHLVDEERRVSILTVGAHIGPERVIADELHSQVFSLPSDPTELALDVTGTLADLPDRTADWFEALLRRPLERHEWWGDGRVPTTIWLFADTGQRLIETRGWHTGIGGPDRITLVRGESTS